MWHAPSELVLPRRLVCGRNDLAESSWSALDESEENVHLSDDQIRLLQYHFLRGGDGEYTCRRAVHYLLLASDLALKAVAPDEVRAPAASFARARAVMITANPPCRLA